MIQCPFFFNDTATTEIYTLSLHDALPICTRICAVTAQGLTGVNISTFRWRTVSERKKGPLGPVGRNTFYWALNVVIEGELIRMRPQLDRLHFLRSLVIDIRFNEGFGKHVTLEHELVVGLERIEGILQ